MKHAHPPRGGRTLILGIACLGLNGLAFAQNELIPRGTLSVDSTLIRVGTQSELAWQIQYPQSVTDIIEVTPTTITSKEELKMRVRVLGSKLKNNNGLGNNTSGVDASNPALLKKGTVTTTTIDDEKNGAIGDQPVEVVWSKNKSSWSRIFYGSQSTVVPTAVVLDTVIAKTDIVDFGARGYLSNWLPLYSTSNNTQNLIVLKNGDPTPPQIASKKYGQINGFLKPYLSTDAQRVKIGAGELLILVELDQTEPLAVGFDYQDLGLLVTFE
jgi:hypothetical protein